MKGRIGQRAFYDRLPEALEAAMTSWTSLTGRPYAPIDAYRCEDATEIVVSMGTLADTAAAVVDHLRAKGRAVGSVDGHGVPALPGRGRWPARSTGRGRSAVIERTDDPAAGSNPLTREVKAALVRPGVGRLADATRHVRVGGPRVARRHPGRPGRLLRLAGRPRGPHPPPRRARASSTRWRCSASRSISCPTVPSGCAGIRSAASARSRPTSCSRPWSARRSGATCRPTRATAPRRRGSRPATS